MYTMCKRLSVLCTLLSIPLTGETLEVSFTQLSETTGTVVVSGDPVVGYLWTGHAGHRGEKKTEGVCLNTQTGPGIILKELWCSSIMPAPWIERDMVLNVGPTATYPPSAVTFWEAWRRYVPGKTYTVTKGAWTGTIQFYCNGWSASVGYEYPTFSWCGVDNDVGSIGQSAWRVPINSGPPKPAACTTYQVSNIDFGTIDPEEINGKKATTRIVVSCDKKASVRVRFMTREGLAIFQMDNGLTTYLKIDDNPGTAGSYQTVAENASSPARAFNLSAELLGTSGIVKPGAFSYTAVVRVDIL
ncbi:Uncharacterised protein [Serratia quinivorans]|uniref:MrpH family fimbial adhesin n=1 Tax=Serratia quinivorans TaxID=137545 RepID=UPI000D97B2D7|nr:hypothetical protein [Serratia quinivorans]SPZ65789.1 Uncharacterised protein [Serratia quinivorans]VEI74006.1 Uncharacterised protein [Serratia quinivorans]